MLVPLFPFWQPVFTLQRPYWIGMLVHGCSAMLYPLCARLRWRHGHATVRDIHQCVEDRRACRDRTAWWSHCSAPTGYEPPWIGRDRDADQADIRYMSAHHAQGWRGSPPSAPRIRICASSRC